MLSLTHLLGKIKSYFFNEKRNPQQLFWTFWRLIFVILFILHTQIFLYMTYSRVLSFQFKFFNLGSYTIAIMVDNKRTTTYRNINSYECIILQKEKRVYFLSSFHMRTHAFLIKMTIMYVVSTPCLFKPYNFRDQQPVKAHAKIPFWNMHPTLICK